MCVKLYNTEYNGPTPVIPGVRPGCILSPVIFLVIMDVLIRKAIEVRRDTVWTISEQLKELGFC